MKQKVRQHLQALPMILLRFNSKGKDDKYYDRVYIPKELKEQLTDMAISMYNETKGEAASASAADDSTPF